MHSYDSETVKGVCHEILDLGSTICSQIKPTYASEKQADIRFSFVENDSCGRKDIAESHSPAEESVEIVITAHQKQIHQTMFIDVWAGLIDKNKNTSRGRFHLI